MADRPSSASPPPIPQPVPLDSLPPPPTPAQLAPPKPGCVRVTQIAPDGKAELAIIVKQTYSLAHGKRGVPLEEQAPIDDEGAVHEEPPDGRAPSIRSMPEGIGLRTGTDLIVQGSATPARPTPEARVGVRLGGVMHEALVFGNRVAEMDGAGRIRFSAPEAFEELPLRYEYAYGGRDPHYEAKIVAEFKQQADPAKWRRAAPPLSDLFKANHPLMYPRNRFGKGYVIEGSPDGVNGRELPNIERPDDRLTPDRLIVGDPLDWIRQPIPIGFDFLDPMAFPRSAMLGVPPVLRGRPGGPDANETPAAMFRRAPEVERGLAPADLSRGSFVDVKPEEIQNILHPLGSRCASLGLWLDELAGDEVVTLTGMSREHPSYEVALPGERPRLELDKLVGKRASVHGSLCQVKIDLNEGTLGLLWVARAPLPRVFMPGELLTLADSVAVKMEVRR